MILDAIKNRRAIRDYKTDPVADDLIHELIVAASFAPTAMGDYALEFIVVRDQKTKEAIYKIIGQEFVKTAPVLIVPVANTKKAVLAELDIAVMTENLMLQATELGLGSVWKHIQPEWVKPVKAILQIPEDFCLINLIPVGYAQEPLDPHLEKDFLDQTIHQEKW